MLQSYQTIYRPSLLKYREGYLGSCPAPTAAQLQQIARLAGMTPAQLQPALQIMAEQLRQIRQSRLLD